MRDKATSLDIAHQAGVSQSTVSRALNDSPLVNKETRDKIKALAKELNYKVDKNASNLRKQQSSTLALLLFEDPTSDDSNINPFFLSMLGSITRACSRQGYDLLVSFQQLSDDWHADYEDSHKADGIILLGYGDFVDYKDKLNKLEEQETHFILWGAIDSERGVVSVSSDNFMGGYEVAQHLCQLGRDHFAFIGEASEHSPEFHWRYKGFCQGLNTAGMSGKVLQIDAINTQESGYNAALKLIKKSPTINGIACASDLIAIGVMRALQDNDRNVPTDVSVVGYDDIPVADFANPPLTTVSQDTNRAGELMVEKLINQIRGEDVRSELLPGKLIVRDSCGAHNRN